jgi:Tol biopolymer transport system component
MKLEISKGWVLPATLMCALLVPPRPAHGFPGANGMIAIGSKREGNMEVFVMNPDGSGQTNLTNLTGVDAHPAWSPDGTRIAFASTREHRNEIFVMNADGTGITQLTVNGTLDSEPAWSPDATRIAFRSTRDGNDEIYVMNSDGSGQTNLTQNAATDAEAAWSPEGTRIVFQSSRGPEGDLEIYLMEPDGTDVRQLTSNDASDSEPAWSPDGSRITFVSNRDGFAGEIYVMDADGSDPVRLTDHPALDDSPVWSPDGTKIAFVSEREGGDREIFTMNADGTGVMRLTFSTGEDQMPDWGAVPSAGGSIAVSDFAFTPGVLTENPGTGVRWEFAGPSQHAVIDRSDMGLFGSGVQGPGSSYGFGFVGAGLYRYGCSIHPAMEGTVRVNLTARPRSGGEATLFLVTWAAGPAPPGFAYDVQVERPDGGFENWKVGQIDPEATFVPDAGSGRYAFRARLRSLPTGNASGYSRPATISVR